MALTRTQLAAACKPSDLKLSVVNTTVGFPAVAQIINPPQPILIDQEMMFLVQVLAPGLIQVRSRGGDGTQARAHDISAPVVTSPNPSDFTDPSAFLITTPNESPRMFTYGQNGPIQQPQSPIGAVAILNGPSAVTMTLGAPSFAITSAPLKIISQTAFAHVISAPGLLQNGGVGSPFSTITFPAAVGAEIELTAQNGFWSVASLAGATTLS